MGTESNSFSENVDDGKVTYQKFYSQVHQRRLYRLVVEADGEVSGLIRYLMKYADVPVVNTAQIKELGNLPLPTASFEELERSKSYFTAKGIEYVTNAIKAVTYFLTTKVNAKVHLEMYNRTEYKVIYEDSLQVVLDKDESLDLIMKDQITAKKSDMDSYMFKDDTESIEYVLKTSMYKFPGFDRVVGRYLDHFKSSGLTAIEFVNAIKFSYTANSEDVTETFKLLISGLQEEGFYANPDILSLMLLPYIYVKEKRITGSVSLMQKEEFELIYHDIRKVRGYEAEFESMVLMEIFSNNIDKMTTRERVLSSFVNLIEATSFFRKVESILNY